MKVLIKYCGGCNSAYDRVALVKEITNLLHTSYPECEVVYRSQDADIGIMISGCDACCIDAEENRSGAPFWIVIGPDLVDYFKVSQREIPLKILDTIKERGDLFVEKGG